MMAIRKLKASLRAAHGRSLSIVAILALSLILTCSACSKSAKDDLKEQSLYSAPTSSEIELLERATSNYDRGYYSIAREAWTELMNGYPNSYYATLAELKAADSRFFAGDYDEALAAYEEFARLHHGHEAIPYVYFQIANTHLQRFRGEKRDQTPLRGAMTGFGKLLEEYPGSLYAAISREKIRESRELLAAYEASVAEFYRRQGLQDAYTHRIQSLEAQFPETASQAMVVANAAPTAEDGIGNNVNDTSRAALLATPSPEATKFLRPETPQLTFAGENLPKIPSPPVLFVQAASAAAARVQSQTPEEKPLLLNLLCEESSGFSVFTAYLTSPLQLEHAENVRDAKTWRAAFKSTRLRPLTFGATTSDVKGFDAVDRDVADSRQRLREVGSTSGNVPTKENSLHCEVAQSKLLLDENPMELLVQASLTRPDNSADVRFFTLDRPYRLVFVVPNQ